MLETYKNIQVLLASVLSLFLFFFLFFLHKARIIVKGQYFLPKHFNPTLFSMIFFLRWFPSKRKLCMPAECSCPLLIYLGFIYIAWSIFYVFILQHCEISSSVLPFSWVTTGILWEKINRESTKVDTYADYFFMYFAPVLLLVIGGSCGNKVPNQLNWILWIICCVLQFFTLLYENCCFPSCSHHSPHCTNFSIAVKDITNRNFTAKPC